MRQRVDIDGEEQLQRMQKVDMMGRLAAGIAHDFNNILTAIVGYADLLAHENLPGRTIDDVAEIRRAAERAAGLTRQILAFTRHETPSTDLVDVNAVVGDVSRMLRRLIDENIALDVDCGAPSSTVRTDAGQLEQVLINLVINARDAMPGGGRISISTRSFVGDVGQGGAHSGRRTGEYIALEVADTGEGMTDEVRARVFDPFFTTKPVGQGTGLGLAVVSSIVGRSNGHILVDSAPGRGTTFTVLLPVSAGAVAGDRGPSVERRRVDGRATILVVEDEEHVRSLTCRWLRRYGYTVFEAGSGDEALALVSSGGVDPDLVITDVVMPALGGTALADSLRATQPMVKVLYMSGYPNRPEVLGRLEQEGVSFLQKPFSPGRLLGEVRTLLTFAGDERRTPSGLGQLPQAPAARGATGTVAILVPRAKTA